MQEQFLNMLRLQDSHNTEVHPQWREQAYPYYRAIWVECAEMLDHFGWKWWKHQEADLDQVRLELVDIWHFGLSELLRSGEVSLNADPAVPERLLECFRFDGTISRGGNEGLRLAIEELAAATLAQRAFDLNAFVTTMKALPMSFDELYQMYIGKNVLNSFRQSHGYKSGKYRKIWNGREDNEHLMELCAEIDPTANDYADQLFQALGRRYPGAE